MQEQTINITKLVNDSNDVLSGKERAAQKKQLAEQLQLLEGASEAEPLTRARLHTAGSLGGRGENLRRAFPVPTTRLPRRAEYGYLALRHLPGRS